MKRIATFAAICLLVALFMLASNSRRMRAVEAQGFDVCLEDDSDKGTALRINTTTADYLFCAGGKTYSGKGSLVKSGDIIVLQHLAADRKLSARVDTSAKSGSASFQSPVGKTLGTIRDGNTVDSKCECR
jgi:hypothetical protein